MIEVIKNNKVIFSLIAVSILGITICSSIIVFNSTKNITSVNENQVNNVKDSNLNLKEYTPILYRVYDYKQIYVDKEGNLYDLSTEENLSKYTDFTYGTGILEKDEKNAIIDYKGNFLLDYQNSYINQSGPYFTYNNKLYDNNLNIISENNNYAISDELESNLYYSNLYNLNYEKYDKNFNSIQYTAIITGNGKLISNFKEIESEDIKVWNNKTNNITVLQLENELLVINNKEMKVTYKLNVENFAIGMNQKYIVNFDNNKIYLLNNKAEMFYIIDDIILEKDDIWDEYKSWYTPKDKLINSTDEEYVIYKNKDGKYKLIYKDGTLLKIYDDYVWHYCNYDSLVFEYNDTVDIYNKKELKKTINKHVTEHSDVINSKNVFLLLNLNDYNYYLYNYNGELVSDKAYQKRSHTIFSNENVNYRLLNNGNLINAKNYEDIYLIIDKKTNEYSNNYFIATNNDENTFSSKLIDGDGNNILEVKFNISEGVYLYDNYLIYEKYISDNAYEIDYRVYDLNKRQDIIIDTEEIKFISDYKIFVSDKNIYNINGNKIYQNNE